MIGEYFAFKLHNLISDQVLILPSIGIGCSDHHMDFAGTLTLSHHTFIQQVEQVVDSVILHGFANIVLLNSHGGNQGAGQVLVEKSGYKYPDCEFVMTSWWQLARQGLLEITETDFGGVGHAGEFETSLMMLIAPELVQTDHITNGANKMSFPWSSADMLHGPKATHYRTMKQLTPNGVFGDPRAASVEKGQRITDLVVNHLREIVTDLISG